MRIEILSKKWDVFFHVPGDHLDNEIQLQSKSEYVVNLSTKWQFPNW